MRRILNSIYFVVAIAYYLLSTTDFASKPMFEFDFLANRICCFTAWDSKIRSLEDLELKSANLL